MDRRTEIKKELYCILKNVYKMHPEAEITPRQEEFLEKTMDYLESNISLRRKKEKKVKDGNSLDED